MELEKLRDKAIEDKTNFAFESNYSTKMAIDISLKFRYAGYETSLIYFGLEDLTKCVSRVTDRVKDGGHDVPDEIISLNLEEGIRLVNANLYLYDHVSFVSTTKDDFAKIIASYDKKNETLSLAADLPGWFDKHFNKQLTSLHEWRKSKQASQTEENIKPKGKRPRL